MKARMLMLMIGSLVTGAGCAGPEGISTHQFGTIQEAAHVNQAPTRDWTDFATLADLIAFMPSWDKAAMAEAEQQRAARIAYAVSQMHPHDVETSLIVYMSRLPVRDLRIRDQAMEESKPMILLRMLYEFPRAIVSESEWWRLMQFDAIGGPLPGRLVGPSFSHGEPIWRTWWYPIEWTDAGPQFVEGPRVTGGSGRRYGYFQPQLQFRYMMEHFPRRTDLEQYLGGAEPMDYKDLLSALQEEERKAQ